VPHFLGSYGVREITHKGNYRFQELDGAPSQNVYTAFRLLPYIHLCRINYVLSRLPIQACQALVLRVTEPRIPDHQPIKGREEMYKS